MRSKRHNLARDKGILPAIPRGTQRRPRKQRRQIERRKRIQHNDFMRCIRINRLVQREERRRIVKSLVQRGVGGRKLAREPGDEFVEVGFSLGGGDGGARTVVVVEGEVEVVLVVEEVFFAEEVAEGGVAERVGLVGAELQHGDGVCGGEVNAACLGLEAGDGGVECVDGEAVCDCAADAASTGDVGVVQAWLLDEDLDVDLVQILGHTEEASGKVLCCLDHAVLRLGSEDRDCLCFCEVVQKMAIELSVRDSKEEVLAASKGGQKLCTKLIRPVAEERELARN